MRCFNYFNPLIFLLSVSTGAMASAKSSTTYDEMNQTLKSKDAQIESLKLKNEVLQRKVSEFKKPVVRRLPGRLTDETLYIEVIKYYRGRDAEGVVWAKDQLLKFFPQSAFADNAMYLAGRILLESANYSEAVREFQTLIEKYPHGNKMPAALLGKGIAYRKLNLYPYAEQAFRAVKKEFPGSPEAQRVELEMKLLALQRQ